jgi:predicted MFS family arabinose efflux permease
MESQGEDEPNTPSKSKMLPRRPMGLYALLLLFVVIGGEFRWIIYMSDVLEKHSGVQFWVISSHSNLPAN